MKDSSPQGSLELNVKNFGPIAEAKIDLRPLTVFVGPSNTGKSYLAILIYALHRFFSDDMLIRRRFPVHDPVRDDDDPPKEIRKQLVRWVKHTFEDKDKLLSKKQVRLPETIAGLIRPLLNESSPWGKDLVLGLIRCFGTDEARGLIRKVSQGSAQVAIRKHGSADLEPFAHKLHIGAKKPSLTATIPETSPIWIDASGNTSEFRSRGRISWEGEPEELSEERLAWRLIRDLAVDAFPSLIAPLHQPAFYLPADRTGIMHAHMALTSALIHSAPMAGLRPAAPAPMLSGVLADFLEQLINLATPRYRVPSRQWRYSPHRRSELGDQIEKTILVGTVKAQRSETNYPYFSYRPEGWENDLPLMNASSMVSELAPVVLYLRHVVRPDNVLIIEEPESHLHPAMQVEFTRQLAAIVQAGVRVILTTHSEWVLEELANIVQRSKLPETRKKEIESGIISLRPDEVGVWLFQPKKRPKGSIVKEISLDDSGLFPSGFDEVAATLHNNWADISSRIGESG